MKRLLAFFCVALTGATLSMAAVANDRRGDGHYGLDRQSYRQHDNYRHREHRRHYYSRHRHSGRRSYDNAGYFIGGLLVGSLVHHGHNDAIQYYPHHKKYRHYARYRVTFWRNHYGDCFRVEHRKRGKRYTQVPRFNCY